jgi:sensor histidine kinase YesM
VENAIKHGVAPSKEPVHIRIKAAVEAGDLCIDVENGIAQEVTMTRFGSSGVGLKNIERRLEAVYGRRASLTSEQHSDRYVARICIPEIHRKS